MIKRYSISELRIEFEKHSYIWPDFHLVGIRSKANTPNRFDDIIAVIDHNEIFWFNCTTNAGTHWLKNLLNPKGCANLVPRQYVNTFVLGLHKGIKALKQFRPVYVYRDGNKNDLAEETAVIDCGMFGIDIHQANAKLISQWVDRWSAGCQVVPDPANFKTILNLCSASGRKEFTYTLLKEF